MAIQFGKTWWGSRWLGALTEVDYDNRLPRGASYARNGWVKSLRVNKNQIKARVAGRRAAPYAVSITVPPFFAEDAVQLLDALEQHPALIAGLLNRELHPGILDIAEECGIKVFPDKWTDLKMHCSCPDWAVPCKHLAAVVYLLSREIDNNPFLVFEMHGIDLLKELQKRDIQIPEEQVAIPKFTELVPLTRKKRKNEKPEAIYDSIDFSALPDVAAPMLELLPAEPAFYPAGDFKKKYAARLSRAVKAAARILAGRLTLAAALGLEEGEDKLSRRSTAEIYIDPENRVELGGDLAATSFEEMIGLLARIRPDYLPDYQPAIAALHQSLYAALHLLQAGDIIPQVAAGRKGTILIRWLPAAIEPQAGKLAAELESRLDFDLVFLKRAGRSKTTISRLQHQAEVLLSIFIDRLIRHLATTPKKGEQDAVEELFFGGKLVSFKEIGEKTTGGGIKAWLDRYHVVSSSRFQPLVQVKERGDEHFALSIAFGDQEQPDELPLSLARVLTEPELADERFRILPGLTRLTPFIHGLEDYINSRGKRPLLLNLEQMSPFLIKLMPAIRLLGLEVVLPKSLQRLLKPMVSLRLSKGSGGPASLTLTKLLNFDWRVAIGDALLTREEFNALLDKASGLFRFREQYFYADENELARLRKKLDAHAELGSHQLLQAALAEEYEGARVELTPEVQELIRQISTVEDIPQPRGLQAELRPYQQRGWQWMYHNSRIGFGSLLADDMGLGKTLQVLTFLLKLKEENPAGQYLVAVPTGLLANWQAEIERFTPQLSTHLYHGTGRNLKQFDHDILLTSYGVLRSDAARLKKKKWQAMIIDEAQNIKNEKTAQSKAVKSIPAETRIAMSGTPVENRLSEFWSIMDYTNKGYLGSSKVFRDEYATPIQVSHDLDAANKFRAVTAPFMMRRMKTDSSIISDLPDKVEQNQLAVLTSEQAALYEKTMLAAMDEIEGYSDDDSLFKRQGLVLQMILALKQICNHPANFLKNKNLDPALSGKTSLLFELLDAILAAGEKVLVFTQFKEMGSLLTSFLAERYDETPLFYHGGCTVKERTDMVERFQNNRADRIFILSLKAAGTGLNLTAASQVIHYDLWWNPAVESQATDRAYRIGQQNKVTVHRFITKNTFEEKIDAMIQQKKNLAEMTVATGEKWLGRLSNRELRQIFHQG
ncbi:MAG: helicase SNF2 [Deltaproteobacteria bacterium]|nr:MAG: helicase SNF2 [Deltaproteobacteria bacterium]